MTTSCRRRVLLVSQPTVTGAALHVWYLAKGLDPADFQVTVACPQDGWLGRRIRELGIPYVRLPLVREIRPLADLRAALALWRLIRRVRPHVLHLHASKAGFLGRMLRPLVRVPVVIYTPHGFAFRQVAGWRRWFFLALERGAAHFGDHIVCVSASEWDGAWQAGLGHAGMVTVISNGVDLPDQAPSMRSGLRRRLEVGSGCHLIGMLARLRRPKQPEDLIHAAARLRQRAPVVDYKVVFIGDGPLEAKLRALVERLGLARQVVFLGYRDDVAELLAELDSVVLATRMEGLPFSLLEAMAAGKPVIGSRVPGVTDLIRQADTGLTYPLGDSDTLANHLASLMGDPALRQRLGQAGRHLVRRAFLAGPMVASTANLYDRLLQATGAQKYGQTVG